MWAVFEGRKSIFVVDNVPEPGRFALDAEAPKQPSWDHCREQFAYKLNVETTGFFFSHNANQSDNVAGFMAKSEEILDLPERSKYRTTDRDIVTWVEPARFWMNCWLKRSLLTIFLRCGMHYDPAADNFEDALWGPGVPGDKSREYVKLTKPAVMRFMFGFTKFVPGDIVEPTGALQKDLWVEVFKECSVKKLKMLLVAENPTPGFGLLGADAIWA